MATNYPATIDNSITLPLVSDNLSSVNATSINNLRNAIIAIEQALGVNPAGTSGTVVNRLVTIENSITNLQPIVLSGDLSGTLLQQLVVGFQGRPISPAAPDVGQVFAWNGTAWVPQFVVPGEGYNITLAPPNHFMEIKEALVNPIFTATYSASPVTAVISDNQGNPPQDVFTAPPPSIPPDIFAYQESYEFSTYPATPFSVIFTLTSSDGINTSTATTTVTWVQRIYYGTGSPGGNTAAFIQALTNNSLSDTKTTVFTINASTGQAIYFAYRTAYGSADFWVNGFEGGFNLVSSTISVTNANGFTENYTLYQSSQVDLGITTVNVF